MGTKRGDAGLQGSKRGQSMFLISQRKEARKAARQAKKRRKPMQKANSKHRLADQPEGDNQVQAFSLRSLFLRGPEQHTQISTSNNFEAYLH